MATLSYGGGFCSINASARGVEIHYSGSIRIDDKTPEGCEIFANNKKIIIIAINPNVELGDLFEYEGTMHINDVLVSDQYGNKIPTGVERITDLAQDIQSNAEDMTIESQKMNAGHRKGRIVRKTTIKQNIIKNLHTSNFDGSLYLEDGSAYSGYYHIHKGGGAMTGRDHDEGSRDLFYKRKEETKLTSTKVVNERPRGTSARTTTSESGGY